MARTVMVVDDHAISREGLAVILRWNGYDVIALDNGRQALELRMTGTRPDVILLIKQSASEAAGGHRYG